MNIRTITLGVAALALVAACSSSRSASVTYPSATPPAVTSGASPSPATSPAGSAAPSSAGTPVSFKAEVWADNWFSLYINGKLVGEDSVPITTVRSFNAETISFTATYPLTIAMISKDYEEATNGLEYIGTDRQQMGDGGFIAQITDTSTGTVVATTGSDWRGLVINRAPLNVDCEKSVDPATSCQFEITDEPPNWTSATFDDSAWVTATVYTAAEVGAKEGYTTITWNDSAALIWTSSLKVDNTILWRHQVPSAP